ncbi:MAG: hypothetical protein SGARI_004606, partial [Bacillariaceae sp.]
MYDEPIDLEDFLSPEQKLQDFVENELFADEDAQGHRELNGNFCNVCGTSPYGARFLTNKGKQFWNNGKKWSCGQVQTSMRDVRVRGQFATAQDKRWCATVQTIVIQNCDCYGAELVDEYKDPGQVCSLCGGNKKVPQWKRDKLAQTGV